MALHDCGNSQQRQHHRTNTLTKSASTQSHSSHTDTPRCLAMKAAPNRTTRAVAVIAADSSRSPRGSTNASRKSPGLCPAYAACTTKTEDDGHGNHEQSNCHHPTRKPGHERSDQE